MAKQRYIRLLPIISILTSLATSKESSELTDKYFYSRITENTHTLVLFYVPWCKHSQLLLPEYSKAAEELIKNNPPIALVKVDCSEDSEEICQEFAHDNSYPTLKIFHNGKFAADYNGPMISYGIVKYMKAQARPASQELSSLEEVEIFRKASKEPIVVGFFTSNSSIRDVFKETADKLKVRLHFAHCQDLVEDKIVLHRPLHLANNFEESSLSYAGAAETLAIQSFILKSMHGLVGIRKLNNQEDFCDPLVIVYISIDYKINAKATNYWRNRVLMVAQEFKTINFAISSSDEFATELRTIGIEFIANEKPIVVARSQNKKYVLEEEFSVSSLKQLVVHFLEAKLEPYVKSEPIVIAQTEPVIVAVTKNFEKIVNKNDQDTLIKFHAPWCNHCKNLMPLYKELAAQLQNENIAIVEMDAEANAVPALYKVSGYPTIYWVPKNEKNSPIKYTGGRTLEDFIKFIAKEATEELKDWDRKGNTRSKKIEL